MAVRHAHQREVQGAMLRAEGIILVHSDVRTFRSDLRRVQEVAWHRDHANGRGSVNMTRHAQQQAERNVTNRGMTAREAAELYGLKPSAFRKARREGKIPDPTLPCGRYNRVLLEHAMDQLSGINKQPAGLAALDEWRSRRGSRQS